jgi:Peptidase A4 family
VLQAGIEQDTDLGGHGVYYAWYSWITSSNDESTMGITVDIANFPVNNGETIFCSLLYLESRRAGQIYLANVDTGAWLPMTLAAPPNATLSGSSAEWIMEAPMESPLNLPVFGQVKFTSAVCCGNMLAAFGHPGDGTPVNIEDAASTFTSVKTGSGTTTITYTYTGPA